MSTTKNYRKQQFSKVDTKCGDYKPKLRIVGPDGATNWMDIEESELKAIKDLLTQ